MPAGDYAVLYARLCLRLALQRPESTLARLGLVGVQSAARAGGGAVANRTFWGRFDSPGFPVLYAAEDVETCEAEVAHHLRTHYLRFQLAAHHQIFRYSLLELPLSGRFDDIRRHSTPGLQSPSRLSYPAARQYAIAAFEVGLDGLLYDSPRHHGPCVARFLPGGLRVPYATIGARTFVWTGKRLVLQS